MRALSLLLVLPLLAGCGDAVDTAVTARDCAGLAQDVAATGLGQVPSRAQAEEAVQRLDDRIGSLGDPEVEEAATRLRDRLRDLGDAAQRGDAGSVREATRDARDAAGDVAAACSLPVGQFL